MTTFVIQDHDISYNKDSRTFITEISDLTSLNTDFIYSDIRLVNKNTNNSKVFYFFKTDRNMDNEITGWRFITDDSYELLIIND